MVCTLNDNLILHTFSNSEVMGHSFNMSKGCEHKLITTCNETELDLEIRVDFFMNNFNSTKVSIYYEGLMVMIDENSNLDPTTSPNDSIIVYNKNADTVSVVIPDVVNITKSCAELIIKIDNESTAPLTGLCGGMNGQLLFPNCTTTDHLGGCMDYFQHAYKVADSSDLILSEERKECGMSNTL